MISREEAKLILEDIYNSTYDGWNNILAEGKEVPAFLEDDIAALKLAIEALSQPERPKGRWIRNKLWTYECSCCGRLISMVLSNEKINELYPYCHCGADMRDGEEE